MGGKSQVVDQVFFGYAKNLGLRYDDEENATTERELLDGSDTRTLEYRHDYIR